MTFNLELWFPCGKLDSQGRVKVQGHRTKQLLVMLLRDVFLGVCAKVVSMTSNEGLVT